MNKKSLQAKKNHHYVWAHYLARWSDDGKNVWHTTPTGKIILDSVKAFAKEDYFYKSKKLTPNHIHIIRYLSSLSPRNLQEQHEAFLSDFLKVQELGAVYQASGVRDHEADQALYALECNMMENRHSSRDLCITVILAKTWKCAIDFIEKNLMKFADMELCRGLKP